MKYLIYLFTIAQATKNPGKFCDLLSDDVTKQCFVKETLLSIAHSPNQLAIDKSTNTLYFSFDSGQGEYIPAAFKIDTKKLSIIKGIKDAFAVATDDQNMYFGGSHGIYRYNPNSMTLKKLAIKNLDVWWLFVKRNVHFIQFPSLSAYSYENRTLKFIDELKGVAVQQFVIDKKNNVFFINSTGLYGVEKEKNRNNIHTELLRDNPRFVGMAMDNVGLVYVCSEDGIFVISQVVKKVKRILDIKGVLGMTFDQHNHMVYSDSHELVRLVPVSKNNFHNTV